MTSPHTTSVMSRTRKVLLVFAIWTLFGLTARFVLGALAAAPASPEFARTWQRTDQPVADLLVSRTWMWGEEANTEAVSEPYLEAPGGERLVQYFDKTRMEDNTWRASDAPWDVTNGLLVMELVTGRLQLGDDTFEQHDPAAVNVAGDPDDPEGPQYRTLTGQLNAPALPDGATITQRLDRDGNVTEDPALAAYGVTAAEHVQVPGIDHQVASPFWAFMNSSGLVYENGGYLEAELFLNPFYATGYPITEAYWAEVKVAGTYQEVLLQCFERRCLTYTPGNPEGWQVEAGNVGLHYYTWRYEQIPGEEDDEPGDGSPTPSPTATEPGEDPGPPGEEPSPTEPPSTPTVTPTVTPTETPDPPQDDQPVPTEPEPDTATEYSYAGSWGEMVDSDLEFESLSGLAASPDGYLYAADTFKGVYKYTWDGVYVDSWSSGFVQCLAVDESSNIYVCDGDRNRVMKYSPGGALLDEIGAGVAAFESPNAVAVDSDGYVYVADFIHDVINKFDPDGSFVDQWGDDTGEPAFGDIRGLAVDDNGTIYVVDTYLDHVLLLDTDGAELGVWNDPGLFFSPSGIAVGPSGAIYIVDAYYNNVQVFNSAGTLLGEWGTSGSGPGEFNLAEAISIDTDGNVYVTDKGNDRIQVFDARGNYLDQWNGAHRGRLAIPTSGIAADGDDNVYLLDMRYSRIQKFSDDGDFVLEFETSDFGTQLFRENDDLAVGRDGYLYAVDSENKKLLRFTRDGDRAGEHSIGQVDFASGIATDEQGNFYVSDLDVVLSVSGGVPSVNGGSVHKYSSSGAFLGTWEDSRMDSAVDVAAYGGRVYVVDPANNLVHVFDADGTYLEAWDEPAGGGGPFALPLGVAVDRDGYVYVVDSGNTRVVKLTPAGEYLTEFGASTHPIGQVDTFADIAVSKNGSVFLLSFKLTGGGYVDVIRVHVFEPVN